MIESHDVDSYESDCNSLPALVFSQVKADLLAGSGVDCQCGVSSFEDFLVDVDKEEDAVPAFRSTTYLLAQVSNLIRNSWIDPALKKYGITSLQYTILAVINRYSGLSSAELARHFFVTPQTIGPILAQLEKRDLLVRDENQENRRLLSIRLTPTGKILLVKCDAEIQEIENIIFREFNENSLEEFRGYLKGLSARCREQRR